MKDSSAYPSKCWGRWRLCLTWAGCLWALLPVVGFTPALADNAHDTVTPSKRIERLQTDLLRQTERAEQGDAKATLLQTKLDASKAQLAVERDALRDAKSTIEKLRQGERESAAALDDLRASNDALVRKNGELERRLESARSQNSALAEQLEQTRTKLFEVDRRIEQLQETQTATIARVGAKEERLQAQIAELRQTVDQQAGELDTVGIERLQTSQDLKLAKGQLLAVTRERDALAATNAALQQQLSEVESALKSARDALQTGETALATARQERAQVPEASDAASRNGDAPGRGATRAERRSQKSGTGPVRRPAGSTDSQSNPPRADTKAALLEDLQERARRYADAFRKAHRAWNVNRQDKALRAHLIQSESDLYRSQSAIADTLNGKVHRVLPNESLSTIARAAYGDANRWRAIFDANTHVLRNPDRVVPGMSLVLP